MQPIERYGVAALLFLIVTIGAVVLWDQSETQAAPPGEDEVAAVEREVEAPAPRSGLNRDRVGEPRLPADPKGARASEGPRRHQAGTTPSIEVQEQKWGKAQGGPQLPTKPKTQPKKQQPSNQQQPAIGTGNPGPKATPPQAEPAKKPGGNLLQPKPKAEPASKPDLRTYVVQPGDVMGSIAQQQLGGVRHLDALLKANPTVVPERMSVGTKLVLPDVDGAPADAGLAQATPQKAKAEPKSQPKREAPASGRTYRVAEGDSLWRIAERELGSGPRYAELQELNPGAGSNLKVGMVLRLPDGAAAPARSTVVAKADTGSSERAGRTRRVVH